MLGNRRTALVAGIIALALPGLALAAAGDLDPEFSGDGKVTGEVLGTALGSDVYPDGRVVIAGVDDDDFTLARYLPDGSLDPSFGDGGVVSSNFDERDDIAWGVAVLANGRIVAVGETTGPAGRGDFAVARYLEDGTPDESFSNNGKVRTDLGTGADAALDVEVFKRKIVAVGLAGNNTVAMARYRRDGALDESFSQNGKVVDDVAVAQASAVQDDGRVVVVGERSLPGSTLGFVVARYTKGGQRDHSFSGNGWVPARLGRRSDARGVTVGAAGKIIAVGRSGGEDAKFAIARFLDDGRLDRSFSNDGTVQTDFGPFPDAAREVVRQDNGRILVAGDDWTSDEGGSARWALARYTRRGQLDDSFSNNGKTTIRFGTGYAEARGLDLVPGSKALVAGFETVGGGDEADTYFAAARLLLD